jgi:crotonobetainyl-CoA:carnitine CoA-transferase CaiB-like acyl-CoA transferase
MQRERTGEGALVEIPMFESMVGFNLVEHFYGQHFVPPLSGAGYPRVLVPWRRPYRTSDGHLSMMPYTTTHWQRFFAEVGRPDLAADPRFADIAQRTKHIAELLELASGFVEKHNTAYWIATCERLEIPAAPVGRLDDLPQDPHLLATGFFESVQDPAMGELRFPGVPVRFNGQRPPVALPPRLGEHTRPLLSAAGLSAEQIDAMLGSGAAVAPTLSNDAGVPRT